MNEQPVDLVYLWCDMADENWRRKREQTMLACGRTVDAKSNAGCRAIAHDELRYSLRSVARCAGWIRRIHVVIDDDNRPPAWLQTDGGSLRVVKMSEIMPREILPCFCSDTIEHHLANIPDLAERFLYANDDMMFYKPVSPSFFFDEKGRTVCRFGAGGRRKPGHPRYTTYHACIDNSESLIANSFGYVGEFVKARGKSPHHNVDAYLKSSMLECRKRFAKEIGESGAFENPFRSAQNFQRELYTYFDLATGRGVFRRATFNTSASSPWWKKILPHRADSLHFTRKQWYSGPAELKRLRPGLFCFNDTFDTTEDDRAWLQDVYRELFPEKCIFEK